MQLQLNEATAARREIPIHLVDSSDGMTPITGETPTVQIRKAGGVAWAASAGSVAEIGTGAYIYTATAGELDTLGLLDLRSQGGSSAEYQISTQVVGFDPFASDLGIPNAGNLSNLDAPISGLNDFDPANDTVATVTNVTNIVTANLTQWLGGTPLGLQTQRVQTFVGDLANNVITSAKFAADAISAAAFSQGAADKAWNTTVRVGTAPAPGTALEASVQALNDITPAEVKSEVDQALIDIRANEIMAAALTAQPANGSMWGDLTEDNAGTQRFTAAALSQAPTGGGGGDATAANQQEILDRIGTFDHGTNALNTVEGYIASALRRDVTVPPQLGGTYDPNAHSQEAIREDASSESDISTAVWDHVINSGVSARLMVRRVAGKVFGTRSGFSAGQAGDGTFAKIGGSSQVQDQHDADGNSTGLGVRFDDS